MSPLPVVERHPSLRWLVPAVVVGALVVVLIDAIRPDDSPTTLPLVDASTLVSQVQAAERSSFSGTVVAQLSDGAAALTAVNGLEPATSLAGLQAGSHTLRVWYGGPAEQRVAVVGALEETDLFRSGSDVWQWSSASRLAVHSKVAGSLPSGSSLWTSAASLTPIDLAREALAAASTGTTVSVAGAEEVADRPVYGLVLRPDSGTTLVDYVHIAVDGKTKTPLAVEIYPRGASDPAIDVSFTSIRFADQPSSMFDFVPPEGATVRSAAATASASVSTYGSGWSTVLCFDRVPAAATNLTNLDVGAVQPTTVKGGWGKGRLVQSPLLTVLATTDGRLYVGAVAPATLYLAAAQ